MQNITQSWFVQGMIKATTDAWLNIHMIFVSW